MSAVTPVGKPASIMLAVAAAALWLMVMPPSVAALCGDLGGDGRVLAVDALATLRAAVNHEYDERVDIRRNGQTDDRVNATDALAVLRAAVGKTIPPCAAATATRAVVATASLFFDSSGIAVVDLETHESVFRPGALYRDSVLRNSDGAVVGINRFGANSLKVFDIDDPNLVTIKECSVSDGFNSNPHDVALFGNKGYVALYESNELLVIDRNVLEDPAVDPACDSLITGRIDLTALADSDGLPEMDRVAVVGDRAYVALQTLVHARLFEPAGTAALAVIDTAQNRLAGSIPLALQNPFAETKGLIVGPHRKRLYLGGPGIIFTDLTDGGIEAVDLDTQASLGLLVTGAELGGDLFDFVMVGSQRAYAVVTGADQINRVLEVDLIQRNTGAELLASREPITDIEMTEDGMLWVAFREDSAEAAPGLRVFDVATNRETTPQPIFPGNLPFVLIFAD